MPTDPYEQQQAALKRAIARFPARFGLRKFPGKIFSISQSASYWDSGYSSGVQQHAGAPILYVYIYEDGRWQAFAKGDEDELKREVVFLPSEDPPERTPKSRRRGGGGLSALVEKTSVLLFVPGLQTSEIRVAMLIGEEYAGEDLLHILSPINVGAPAFRDCVYQGKSGVCAKLEARDAILDRLFESVVAAYPGALMVSEEGRVRSPEWN